MPPLRPPLDISLVLYLAFESHAFWLEAIRGEAFQKAFSGNAGKRRTAIVCGELLYDRKVFFQQLRQVACGDKKVKDPLLRVVDDLSHDTAFVVAEKLVTPFGYTFGDVLPCVRIPADPKRLVEQLR
jgi:hypothetical protein